MLPEGTNTYLVGQTSPYILIDTGEGRGEYVCVLEEALNAGPLAAGRAEISDIILTHKHHDHTNGVPSVLELLHRRWETRRSTETATYPAPRVHKMPLTTPQLSAILDPVPRHLFAEAPAGHILHDIHEGQYFAVASEGGDADASEMRLEVIHTPGHTDDSLCLFFPSDRALFTADTVLGQSSTVFEDLGRYMGSLRKLINFNSPTGRGEAQVRHAVPWPRPHGPARPRWDVPAPSRRPGVPSRAGHRADPVRGRRRGVDDVDAGAEHIREVPAGAVGARRAERRPTSTEAGVGGARRPARRRREAHKVEVCRINQINLYHLRCIL